MSHLETVFGAVCWRTNISILRVHPNLVGNIACSICGQISGTLSRFPMCFTSSWNSSFGDCQRIWTTIHNQKLKYAVERKKSVTGKTHNGHNGPKKWPYGLPGGYYECSSTPNMASNILKPCTNHLAIWSFGGPLGGCPLLMFWLDLCFLTFFLTDVTKIMSVRCRFYECDERFGFYDQVCFYSHLRRSQIFLEVSINGGVPQ